MVFNKQFINLYFTLPDDIKILIMEYNSQHRRLLSKTFQDIKLTAAFKRVDYLTKIYNNDCDSHFRNFTERQYRCFTDLINIYVDDHKYLFNSLKICNCCPRHMTNRPDHIKCGGMYSEYPTIQKDEEYYSCNCNCKCRHVMRQLQRSYRYRY